jgi:hypothetical protein
VRECVGISERQCGNQPVRMEKLAVGMYKLECEYIGISLRLCELVKEDTGISEFECGS